MGQADQSVNIWHWRADNEAGPAETPASGYVDQYPATDDLHYPARAAGNPYAQPHGGTVQNLVAGGFGTLTPIDAQQVRGHGTHDGERWTVVFARDYPAPGPFQPTFVDGQVIDVAFAAWDGALAQRDGIKSVTSFVQLELTGNAPPTSSLVPAAVVAALAVLGGGVIAARRRRRHPVTATDTDS
jgi:hypothetical protein